jgi:hypothetical protein
MTKFEFWKEKVRVRKEKLAKAKQSVKDFTALVAKAVQKREHHRPKPKRKWHPTAIDDHYSDAGGSFLNVPAKIVWHTTEGTSLPNYGTGSAPHFTLNPRTNQLWQHMAIDRVAKALAHPAGTVETNRAHAIQVELIGFAGTTQDWSDVEYARIAELARWIEFNAGVKRQCSVKFFRGVSRLSPSAWLSYSGHIGHCHVPGNDHWDPGAFKIAKVI